MEILPDFVVHAPLYHFVVEGALLVWILWLLFRKSYSPTERSKLSEKDKQELINEWQPEPLVPKVDGNNSILSPRIIEGPLTKYVTIDSKKSLNLATYNFLNLVGNKRIEEKAVKAIEKYGVGSCGPRGFYGTIDVHLELEERLAKYFKVEEGIIYSYGFSTIASAIPAYSKRGDVVFCDDGVHFAIQKGLIASRSVVKFFKHNDIDDLKRLLKEQEDDDIRNPKKAKATRRFLVVEGLYLNYGDICNLPPMIDLKYKYKFRIFIDETGSFGALGKTGRGITEHYNVDINKIDLISSSLETSLGSVGGFCVGSSFVVDHQRLSGQGYCFSASLPPLLATAAIEALNIMEEKPTIFGELESKCKLVHESLKKLSDYHVTGLDISPIKHVRLIANNSLERLEQVVNYAQTKNVSLTVARYLKEEMHPIEPSIRITVNVDLNSNEIETLQSVLNEAVKSL